MSKYTDLEIKIKKQLSWDFLGNFQSAFRWLWVEFDSLREYIPWDSIKSIDWKTTAKLWNVHVKNYEEEKDLKILFIIDNSKSLKFGSEKVTKKQTLEQIFFLLAQSAVSTWHSIWIKITHPQPLHSKEGGNITFLDFKKWEENIIKTIKILDKIIKTPSTPKETRWIDSKNQEKLPCVRGWGWGNIKNTLIFHLTDSLTPNINNLKYLNILNEIIYINIFDYFENNLSEDNFEVNFSNKFKNLFFWKNREIPEYKQLRKNKIQALEKMLRKQNIEYLSLDNRDDIFLEFYRFFNSYKI